MAWYIAYMLGCKSCHLRLDLSFETRIGSSGFWSLRLGSLRLFYHILPYSILSAGILYTCLDASPMWYKDASLMYRDVGSESYVILHIIF